MKRMAVAIVAIGVLLAGCGTAIEGKAIASPFERPALDDTSRDWFTAFCEGLAPIQDLSSSMTGATDPAAIGAVVSEAGEKLTATVTNLSSLPAPSFDGGDELATKVVAGLGQMATAFTEAGAGLAAGDASAVSGLSSALANNPMQDLANIKVSEETQQAISEIPACKTLGI